MVIGNSACRECGVLVDKVKCNDIFAFEEKKGSVSGILPVNWDENSKLGYIDESPIYDSVAKALGIQSEEKKREIVLYSELAVMGFPVMETLPDIPNKEELISFSCPHCSAEIW